MPSFLAKRIALSIGLGLLTCCFPLAAMSEELPTNVPVEVTQTTDKAVQQPPARHGHFIRNAITPKPQTKRHKRPGNPICFENYVYHLEQKIRQNWHPPEDYKTKLTAVLMTISSTGKLLDYKIIQSSGSASSDKAAIKALKKAFPFEHFPKEYTRSFVKIHFNFDYVGLKKGNNDNAQKIEREDTPPETNTIQNFDPSLFQSRPQL